MSAYVLFFGLFGVFFTSAFCQSIHLSPGWRPMSGAISLPAQSSHFISIPSFESANSIELAKIAHHNAQILKYIKGLNPPLQSQPHYHKLAAAHQLPISIQNVHHHHQSHQQPHHDLSAFTANLLPSSSQHSHTIVPASVSVKTAHHGHKQHYRPEFSNFHYINNQYPSTPKYNGYNGNLAAFSLKPASMNNHPFGDVGSTVRVTNYRESAYTNPSFQITAKPHPVMNKLQAHLAIANKLKHDQQHYLIPQKTSDNLPFPQSIITSFSHFGPASHLIRPVSPANYSVKPQPLAPVRYQTTTQPAFTSAATQLTSHTLPPHQYQFTTPRPSQSSQPRNKPKVVLQFTTEGDNYQDQIRVHANNFQGIVESHTNKPNEDYVKDLVPPPYLGKQKFGQRDVTRAVNTQASPSTKQHNVRFPSESDIVKQKHKFEIPDLSKYYYNLDDHQVSSTTQNPYRYSYEIRPSQEVGNVGSYTSPATPATIPSTTASPSTTSTVIPDVYKVFESMEQKFRNNPFMQHYYNEQADKKFKDQPPKQTITHSFFTIEDAVTPPVGLKAIHASPSPVSYENHFKHEVPPPPPSEETYRTTSTSTYSPIREITTQEFTTVAPTTQKPKLRRRRPRPQQRPSVTTTASTPFTELNDVEENSVSHVKVADNSYTPRPDTRERIRGRPVRPTDSAEIKPNRGRRPVPVRNQADNSRFNDQSYNKQPIFEETTTKQVRQRPLSTSISTSTIPETTRTTATTGATSTISSTSTEAQTLYSPVVTDVAHFSVETTHYSSPTAVDNTNEPLENEIALGTTKLFVPPSLPTFATFSTTTASPLPVQTSETVAVSPASTHTPHVRHRENFKYRNRLPQNRPKLTRPKDEILNEVQDESLPTVNTFVEPEAPLISSENPEVASPPTIRLRPQTKYDIKSRPRFSIKEYAQRQKNSGSSENESAASTEAPSSTPSTTRGVRYPTRNRLLPDVKTVQSNEPVKNSSRPDGTNRLNLRNNVFKNRYKSTTETQPLSTTAAPTTRSYSPRTTNSTRRTFKNRVRYSTTESPQSVEPTQRSIRNATIYNRRPQVVTRQRIVVKPETEEVVSLDAEEDNLVAATSDETKVTVEAPSTETGERETAIMKIAKDDHSYRPHTSTKNDLTESPSELSEKVAKLTISGNSGNRYNSVNTSGGPARKVPNYFTLATEDPILPIEAFFPNVNNKQSKEITY